MYIYILLIIGKTTRIDIIDNFIYRKTINSKMMEQLIWIHERLLKNK